MGGAFTYWPGSHLTTHQFFLQNPEQIDGRVFCRPDFNWGGPNEVTRLAPLPSREFTACAGDIILWHAFLVHTGSANIRSTPRVGMFARYNHQNQEEFKYEVPQNLWKYWAI
jgi:ectoine hydroxylase-related dioxygenase (phytanoyl-CoA dioxygenase family)